MSQLGQRRRLSDGSVGLACLGVQTCRDFHNLRPGAKPLSLNFCKSHHARRDARGDECRLRDATPPKPDHLETTGTRLEAEERGVQSMYSSLSEELSLPKIISGHSGDATPTKSGWQQSRRI